MTTTSDTNLYFSNGQLYIQPTLSSLVIQDIMKDGTNYTLPGCTATEPVSAAPPAAGNGTTTNTTATPTHGTHPTTTTNVTTSATQLAVLGRRDATMQNASACTASTSDSLGKVINPVMSARISTKGKVGIRYGRVEIKAKLPRGYVVCLLGSRLPLMIRRVGTGCGLRSGCSQRMRRMASGPFLAKSTYVHRARGLMNVDDDLCRSSKVEETHRRTQHKEVITSARPSTMGSPASSHQYRRRRIRVRPITVLSSPRLTHRTSRRISSKTDLRLVLPETQFLRRGVSHVRYRMGRQFHAVLCRLTGEHDSGG